MQVRQLGRAGAVAQADVQQVAQHQTIACEMRDLTLRPVTLRPRPCAPSLSDTRQPVKRQSGAPLSDETVQRMLAVQEQKLGLELKQVEVSLREIEHNQKIADKSIQAQAEDRKDERASQRSMHGQTLVFVFACALMSFAFVGWALYVGKDAFVLDLLKVILGFVGGWGAANIRARMRKDDSDD